MAQQTLSRHTWQDHTAHNRTAHNRTAHNHTAQDHTAQAATWQPVPLTGLGWAYLRSLGQPSLPAPPTSLILGNQTRKRPRRPHRRRWLWRVFLVVLLLAALIAGLAYLLNASFFRIQHLTIEGTSNPQILSGIEALHLEGENILLADTRLDEARIRALPAVANASVSRSFPDTLVIQITERQPVLIWQAGNQQLSIDASGVLIAQVQEPHSLPVIIDEHALDSAGKPFAPGGKIDPTIVKMARQLLERLPGEPGISSFSLRFTIAYGMVVISADGWQARFGDPQGLENKIQMLVAILRIARQRQQALAVVDLRFGAYPYYRLQAPETGD